MRKIFLPLCGKTVDIHWLLRQGFSVVGIDLSPVAVEELFAELKLMPEITTDGDLTRYSAADLDIFVGDILALDRAKLGAVDAVYDRAALVALPADMRADYARHVAQIAGDAPQLLMTFEYNPQLFDGPPFSVDGTEIERLYADDYDATLLERRRVPGGLKRHDDVDEATWLLNRRG